MPHLALLQSLASIVGAAHVLGREVGEVGATSSDNAAVADLAAFEQDWRQRERGKALAVVLPASTDEVAQVVQACARAGVSIVPQGGNTGMVLGSIPDATGTQVVLSLRRMDRIRSVDAANLTVTVEAGCILQNLQAACAQHGLLFPLSLASEGSCTIGGNLATNAGGTQVVRYGNARDLCLGLEVVTAQGQVWSGLAGLRKDNTGYDLRHLLIGSEGTLGIITAATLKLYPQPNAQLTAFAAVPSLQAAVDLLGMAHQHLHAGLTGFEVMGQGALGLVRKHFGALLVPFFASAAIAPRRTLPKPSDTPGTDQGTLSPAHAPYFVVLEHSDWESEAHARTQLEGLLAAALAQGCVLDAVVAQSLAQAQALWHIRECIPLAQAQEGLNVKHDIALPVSRIPAFVHDTDALLAQTFPGVRLVNYGHLGDGNLHYNVQAPEGTDAAAFLRTQEGPINALVYDMVQRFGGSISAEHGIGSLKRDTLAHYKSPVALAAMRGIKAALDPQKLLNPGRVL